MKEGISAWVALLFMLVAMAGGVVIGRDIGPPDWELPDSHYYDVKLVRTEHGNYIFNYTLEPAPHKAITKMVWVFETPSLDRVYETPYEMMRDDRVIYLDGASFFEWSNEGLEYKSSVDMMALLLDEKYNNKR